MDVNSASSKPASERIVKTILIVIIIGIVAGTIGIVIWLHATATNLVQSTAQQLSESTATKQQAMQVIAKRWEKVPIQLPGAQPIDALFEDYSLPNSLWIVVNKVRPISTEYIPASIAIPDVPTRTDKSAEERSVDSRVLTPLKEMFTAAAAQGHQLMIGSAYRSPSLQQTYFNSYAAASGIAAANQYSAYPGQSEHQLGLAVDISSLSQSCYLDECFTSTPDGQWLAQNAYKFGFVLRYPLGKESITGYNFEPWHYRYVGTELATALFESGITLDEAWPYLESALQTLRANHAVFSNVP